MADTKSRVSPPPLKRKRKRLDSDVEGFVQGLPDARKALDQLTIYSWNVNGIAPFIQRPITSFFKPSQKHHGEDSHFSQATLSLRQLLERNNWPSILFLQEVKINLEDSSTISAVQRAVRRPEGESETPDYCAHFCLPSDRYNARGFGRKVYGVCSIIRTDLYDRFVETIRPVDWDKEGRFQIIETRAVDHLPKLAIINVYAVNGTDNPYKDPETGALAGTRHDRKLEVHALLQAEYRKLEAEGFSCIIAGDINIARAPIDGFPNLRTSPKQHCINRADLEQRFFSSNAGKLSPFSGAPATAGLGMIDTFRHLHPERRGYTYYPRTQKFGDSCDRVDMIFISEKLKGYLEAAGMHETPAARGPSDHVPLYAQLDFGRGVEIDKS